jgi:GNAT superfamily N-acetyltransferase
MTKIFEIKPATKNDTDLNLALINDITYYEKLADQVLANEKDSIKHLFSEKTFAEYLIVFENNVPIGFAIFFSNFSTFLCKFGIYLEDLFIKENYRGNGYGKKLLLALVKITYKRNC